LDFTLGPSVLVFSLLIIIHNGHRRFGGNDGQVQVHLGFMLLNNFGFLFSWICKVVCKKQENEIGNQSQIPDPSRQQRRAPARSPVLLLFLGGKPHGHFDHKNCTKMPSLSEMNNCILTFQ
jgi:hypothetical protein